MGSSLRLPRSMRAPHAAFWAAKTPETRWSSRQGRAAPPTWSWLVCGLGSMTPRTCRRSPVLLQDGILDRHHKHLDFLQRTGRRANELALAGRAEWRRVRCRVIGHQKLPVLTREHLCSQLPAHQDRTKHLGRGCTCPPRGQPSQETTPTLLYLCCTNSGQHRGAGAALPFPLVYTEGALKQERHKSPTTGESHVQRKHWLSKFQ